MYGPVTQYGPNLIATPPYGSLAKYNFEDGTIGGWQPAQNCSLANTTNQSQGGTRSLQVTSTAAADMYPTAWASGTSSFIVTPGLPYTLQAWTRANTVARNVTAQMQFLNAAGSNILTTPASYTLNSTTGWTLHYTNGVAPPLAVYCQCLVYFQAPGSIGEIHYIDLVSANQGWFYSQ